MSEGILRENVASVIFNDKGQLLLAKTINKPIWQFPQGGVNTNETAHEALCRELHEELGLSQDDVDVIAVAKKQHIYYLPKNLYRKNNSQDTIIGQKQQWFLLRLKSDDAVIHFDATNSPEIEDFMWVSYWYPLQQIIYFKKRVYRSILLEFRYHMTVNIK